MSTPSEPPDLSAEETVTHRTWATFAGNEPATPSIQTGSLPLAPLGIDGNDLEDGDELGRGAMGVVTLAWQRSLGREVAVKRVHDQAAQGAAETLIAEARTTGKLEHPGIPTVHALCQRDGQPMLVMKRIQGVAWRELVGHDDHPGWAGTGLAALEPCWRHVEIAMRVCDALAYAHDQGVVHRDVKPANVMLGGYGEVVLLDWGLATKWAELAARAPPLPVVGTPAYMPPEMADGRAEPRTDVYLLGTTLVHALTGAPMRTGTNWLRVIREIYTSSAAELPDTFPTSVRDLVRAATEPDPERRPASAVALRALLRGALDKRTALSLAARSRERVTEATGAAPERRERLLTEARFGFLQAAKDLPEVRDDLQRCTLALVHHALDRGQLVSALTLAEELEREEPALAETLRQVRLSAAHQEELVRVARDLDPAVAARWRIRYLTGLAGLMTGLGVVVSLAAALPQGTGYWVAIWGSGNAAVFTLLGMVLWRNRLFANEYNRRVMFLVAIACTGVFVDRTVHAWLGAPVAHALVQDLVLLGVIAGVVGVLFSRWMLLVALICVAAAFGAIAAPAWTPWILGATVLTGGGVAIASLRAGSAPALGPG
jgi:hypothetical protein